MLFGFVKMVIIQEVYVFRGLAYEKAYDIVNLLPFLELQFQMLFQLKGFPLELVVGVKPFRQLYLIMLTVSSHSEDKVYVS